VKERVPPRNPFDAATVNSRNNPATAVCLRGSSVCESHPRKRRWRAEPTVRTETQSRRAPRSDGRALVSHDLVWSDYM